MYSLLTVMLSCLLTGVLSVDTCVVLSCLLTGVLFVDSYVVLSVDRCAVC